jgi:hypothetical protein
MSKDQRTFGLITSTHMRSGSVRVILYASLKYACIPKSPTNRDRDEQTLTETVLFPPSRSANRRSFAPLSLNLRIGRSTVLPPVDVFTRTPVRKRCSLRRSRSGRPCFGLRRFVWPGWPKKSRQTSINRPGLNLRGKSRGGQLVVCRSTPNYHAYIVPVLMSMLINILERAGRADL